MNHQHQLTQEQREWLTSRIQQLRSRMRTAGSFRQAGIHRTIEGMKQQLRSGIWKPHDLTGEAGVGITPPSFVPISNVPRPAQTPLPFCSPASRITPSVDSPGDIADHPAP
ncbi:hypothetical protein [Sphingobium indicum]|uniref:hypothetical protein n=1 Tax=Sphingobium indicum TaxID=332055 RepID=UPI0012DDA5BD|nr:hypothetical protein [Sphingobium indicum]